MTLYFKKMSGPLFANIKHSWVSKLIQRFLFLVCITDPQNLIFAQQKNLWMYNQSDSKTYFLATGQDHHIPFALREIGPGFSSTLRYSYSINGGQAIRQEASLDHNYASSCVNAVGLSTYRIEFQTPVRFEQAGIYKLKIWIDSVDSAPDANHTNDTLIRNYRAVDSLPDRKGLTEYAYHVSCGPCGENGTPYIEKILQEYSEYSYLVKLHNYSGTGPWARLNCAEAIEIDQTIGTSTHPKITFNRADIRPFSNPNFEKFYIYPDVGFCPTNTNWFIKDARFFNTAPLKLNASDITWQPGLQEISFNVGVSFLDSASLGPNCRLSCMLIEDSIYDYQYDNGLPGIDSAWHRFVLRKVFGGTWGEAGIIPASALPGQTIQHTFSGSIPAGLNLNNLYLMPMVQNYSSDWRQREILQASRFRIPKPAISTNLTKLEPSDIKIIPNPSEGNAILETPSDASSIEVFSSQGKIVFQSGLEKQMSDKRFYLEPKTKLSPGVYRIKIQLQNGGILQTKWIITP